MKKKNSKFLCALLKAMLKIVKSLELNLNNFKYDSDYTLLNTNSSHICCENILLPIYQLAKNIYCELVILYLKKRIEYHVYIYLTCNE